MKAFATALRLAARESRRHPVRVVLASHGFAMAIALVIAPAAILHGSRQAAVEFSSELGTNIVQWGPAPSAPADARPVEADLPRISEKFPELKLGAVRVVPARGSSIDPVYLVGSDRESLEIRKTELVAGRLPSGIASSLGAAEPRAEVAVELSLGEQILPELELGRVEELLGRQVAISWPEDETQYARIDWKPEEGAGGYRIVGLVSDESDRQVDRFGYEKDRAFSDLVTNLLIQLGIWAPPAPWRVSGHALIVPRSEVPGETITWSFIEADPVAIPRLAQEFDRYLVGDLGRTPLIYTNALLPVLTNPEIEGYMRLHWILFCVFLVVGCAVVVSITILVGWQRRFEIALLRAEGAQRRDVTLQLFLESLLTAVVGLVLGLVYGMSLAYLRVSFDTNVLLTLAIPWLEVAVTSLLLIIGSALAAVGPSWVAAGQDPALLLRSRG